MDKHQGHLLVPPRLLLEDFQHKLCINPVRCCLLLDVGDQEFVKGLGQEILDPSFHQVESD